MTKLLARFCFLVDRISAFHFFHPFRSARKTLLRIQYLSGEYNLKMFLIKIGTNILTPIPCVM